MKKKRVFFIIIAIIVIVAIVGIVLKRKQNTGGTNGNNVSQENGETQGENGTQQESGENYQTLEDGTKVNTSSKLNKDRKYEGLDFSNFQLTENGGLSQLTADVKNTKSTDLTDYTMVDITFYDKDDKELGTALGLIKPLKAEETTQLNASLTFDYANAYDLKITEHKEEQ